VTNVTTLISPFWILARLALATFLHLPIGSTSSHAPARYHPVTLVAGAARGHYGHLAHDSEVQFRALLEALGQRMGVFRESGGRDEDAT
jgi:hypothetical protein